MNFLCVSLCYENSTNPTFTSKESFENQVMIVVQWLFSKKKDFVDKNEIDFHIEIVVGFVAWFSSSLEYILWMISIKKLISRISTLLFQSILQRVRRNKNKTFDEMNFFL